MDTLLTISGSPHVHSNQSVRKIMYSVFYAMIPAMLVSFYFFGLDAVRVMAISVTACVLVEYVIQRYLIKGDLTINDGSAIVTGVLLAFNVPTSLPHLSSSSGQLLLLVLQKWPLAALGKTHLIRRLSGGYFY